MLAEAWKTRRIEVEPELKVPYMCLVQLPHTPILEKYLRNHKGGTSTHNSMGGTYCCELNFDLSKHGVYVSITTDGQRMFLRVSAQVYNYKEEYYLVRDAVIKVLEVD